MSLAPLIEQTRVVLDAEPAKAAAQFRSSNDLVGVTKVDVRVRGHRFSVDEPADLGGSDLAANPVELALSALGSCQAITYRVWADKLGIELEGVRVDVEGDLDVRGFFGFVDGVRPGYNDVRVTVTLTGPESDETYARLTGQVDAHCPVLDIFAAPVPVTVQVLTTLSV